MLFKIESEERDEIEMYLQAPKMVSLIDQFEIYMRAKLKYEDLDAPVATDYEEIRNKWYEIKNDCGVTDGF